MPIGHGRPQTDLPQGCADPSNPSTESRLLQAPKNGLPAIQPLNGAALVPCPRRLSCCRLPPGLSKRMNVQAIDDVPEKARTAPGGNAQGEASNPVAPGAAVAEEPAEGTGRQGEARMPAGDREDRLRACLEQIYQEKDVPAFSHNVCKVMGLVGDDETSIRTITNTILQDYSLTLAVLRRANSAQYNRSNTRVCSVARAVTLIGVEALRSLVGTMMFLEKYQKRSMPLRKLLLLALLTANHCREIARRLELPDVEEAYLCGMFCNLGEVLVAHHFSDRYNAILTEALAGGMTMEAACLKVMGFRFEDLGRAMAASWNFPESMAHAADHYEAASVLPARPQERLRAVVAFSRDLTHAVYSSGRPDNREAVAALVEKFGLSGRLPPRRLQEVMSSAITETKEMFTSAGMPLNHLHLHRLAGTGPFAQGAEAAARAVDHGNEGAPAPCAQAATPPRVTDEDLLDRLVEEIRQAASPDAGLELNDVVMMVLEACQRGAGFDRVILGLATPDRSMIRGRLGLGPDIDDMIDMLRIPATDPTDPFAVALSRKKDLVVDNTRPNPYQQSKPLQTMGVKCFALYPIVVDQMVVGCLYLDRLRPGGLPGYRIMETIGRLRDTLAETIARVRSAARTR